MQGLIAWSRGAGTWGWCVAFTLLVSACLDARVDPLAIAVAPETHGAILFSEGLSTLPVLLSDNGIAQEGVAEAEAWWDSWEMGETEGAELRSNLHSLAAERLFPLMGLAGVRDFLDKNSVSINAVESVRQIIDAPTITSALTGAKDLHSQAENALAWGEAEAALILALQTVDALWAVSPQQVAGDLLEKATATLGRNQDSGTYSQEELIRIRRLMFGASEALAEGDYPRAIRRAYYACQLLGADPP